MSRETCNNVATNLQRAIENIESAFEDIRLLGADALSTAIATLREKAEREKGCEYCQIKEHKAIAINADTQLVAFAPPIKRVKYLCRPLNYCPMCGRRLKEDKTDG